MGSEGKSPQVAWLTGMDSINWTPVVENPLLAVSIFLFCLEENHGVTAENFEDAEKHCHQVMKALFTEAENDDVNADAEDCFAAAECLFNNIVPHGGKDEQDAGDVLAMVRSFSMFGKRRV